jgi:L-seryl-tRNA(Ser) seleniumtransferase
VPGESKVGGGAVPDRGVPSVLIALDPGERGADRMAAALRRGTPPVVVRVAEGRVHLDLRTIREDEEELLLRALVAAAR